MDRGAARSRNRATKATTTDLAPGVSTGRPDTAGTSASPALPSRRGGRPDRNTADGKRDTLGGKRDGPAPAEGSARQSLLSRGAKCAKPEPGPDQYRPKAIRDAVALIYAQQAFAVPVPAEALRTVRRLDLEGSGVTDLSWVRGSGVTWLSVKGCRGITGWDAVASLDELSVLNISGCGLTDLPADLKGLPKLKALVAMDNPWASLNGDVLAGWTELNSLILSHSPNLASLPSALASLPQLSKLSLSHSPRLTASALPDLSALPYLRDVKLNNLPLLTSLPAHISAWGTGALSAAHADKDGHGDGLEVLDLGNCGLTLGAVGRLFGLDKARFAVPAAHKPKWPHLRSVTLHSNPLALERADYADALRASPDLPKLQIIDSKRVVERKRKGEVQESRVERKRREKREAKRATGANVGGEGNMRAWGGEGEAADGEEFWAAKAKDAGQGKEVKKGGKKRKRDEKESKEGKVREGKERPAGDGKREGNKTRPGDGDAQAGAAVIQSVKDASDSKTKGKGKQAAPAPTPSAGETRPAKKAKRDKPSAAARPVQAPTPTPAPSTAKLVDPSAAAPAKPSRTQTAVVNVIDERAKRRDAAPGAGPVDLAAVLGKQGHTFGAGGW
ncbi:hypothetical protein Q5752_002007 [Cryptotrichosporon argae]